MLVHRRVSVIPHNVHNVQVSVSQCHVNYGAANWTTRGSPLLISMLETAELAASDLSEICNSGIIIHKVNKHLIGANFKSCCLATHKFYICW